MQVLRRLLYVPIIIVLVVALLIIFNVIDFNVVLPVSIEVIAIIAGTLLAGLGLVDVQSTVTSSYSHPEPEDPPQSNKVIYPKVMKDAVESLNEIEEFVVKANGRVDIEIDIEEDPEEEK